MTLVRTTGIGCVWILAALSQGACDSSGPDDNVLVLSGTVVATGSLDAIPGARIDVWSDPAHSGTRERLGGATTDVAGQYSLTASAPPGYAFANCTVMDVVVAADGYVTHDQPLQFSIAVPNNCIQGGAVTANFTLQPIE